MFMNLKDSKIHFVGIGGIGMCGIAEVLHNMGCRVSGSDLSSNTQTEKLVRMGVSVQIGHREQNVPIDCHALVYSSAVQNENPELMRARELKIPIVQRAEMLSELMRLKRGIAVGGSHGKTTTTSMIASLMINSDFKPTIVIGGRLDLIKGTAALGEGPWLLAEADESDGSFLRLSPEIAVVTNIDNDHLDHYKNFENLKSAFGQFAKRIPFFGCAVLCVDDPHVRELAASFEKRSLTYGINPGARLQGSHIQFQDDQQSFEVTLDGKSLGIARIHVPGEHNVRNALATIAVGLELKIPFENILKGLLAYRGVDRRLQKKGEVGGSLIYDDYGHHPTEILATLSALRQKHPTEKLLVVFQPHRFTRTRDCWQQFLKCFQGADEVALLDIYSAGEKPIHGVESHRLVEEIKKSGKQIYYWKDLDGAEKEVQKYFRPKQVILTLGAGDITKLGPRLVPK